MSIPETTTANTSINNIPRLPKPAKDAANLADQLFSFSSNEIHVLIAQIEKFYKSLDLHQYVERIFIPEQKEEKLQSFKEPKELSKKIEEKAAILAAKALEVLRGMVIPPGVPHLFTAAFLARAISPPHGKQGIAALKEQRTIESA